MKYHMIEVWLGAKILSRELIDPSRTRHVVRMRRGGILSDYRHHDVLTLIPAGVLDVTVRRVRIK